MANCRRYFARALDLACCHSFSSSSSGISRIVRPEADTARSIELNRAVNFSFAQPRPNGPQVSRLTFVSSHSMSFFFVHSAAALI